MQICLCALFRSKRIGYSSLCRIRLHGREPNRASIFYMFSTPIDIFHACIQIEVDFPGYYRVLPRVLNIETVRRSRLMIPLFAMQSP